MNWEAAYCQEKATKGRAQKKRKGRCFFREVIRAGISEGDGVWGRLEQSEGEEVLHVAGLGVAAKLARREWAQDTQMTVSAD